MSYNYYMAKKKRNKKYRGRDAGAPDAPIVKHYSVEKKSTFKRWLDDNKRTLVIRGVATGVLSVLALIIFSLVTWIF